MDNLSIELKAISIEGEIWKPFVKTSLLWILSMN